MFNLGALVKMLQGVLWLNELHANEGRYDEFVEEGRTGTLKDLWQKGEWMGDEGWNERVSGYQVQRARTAPETSDYLVDTERFYLRKCGNTWYVYHGFESKDGRFPGSYQHRPSPYGLVLAFELRDGKIMEKQVEVIFRKELEVFYSILEKDQPDRETRIVRQLAGMPVDPEEVGGDKYDPL